MGMQRTDVQGRFSTMLDNFSTKHCDVTLAEDGAYTMIDAVSLTVEAVHAETKGRRIFTVSDYPAFIITDPAAVEFFKHFTTK